MPKRPLPPITNANVVLRLIGQSDLATTRAWRNQDDIRKWFLTSSVISPEQHETWFAQYRDRDDDFVFIIEETETLRRPIGQVSIYGIDWPRRSAKFGRLMIGDPQARGRGLARRAVETLIEYSERDLGLDELHLEVLTGNAPAIGLYESCGFVRRDEVDGEIRMTRAARSGRLGQ